MSGDGWTRETPNLPALAPLVGMEAGSAGDIPAPLARDAHGRSLARDGSGRFLSGNSGGGRPKGARSRLKETFLKTVADDFEQNGAAAIAKLRTDNPEAYARLIGSFIPREPVRDEFGDLSHDEIVELIERAEQHRFVLRMIEAGEKKP